MILLPILPELSNAVQVANPGNSIGAGLSVSIVVGIVSGILTTALIFGFVQLFKKIVVPWCQALFYRGLDISATPYRGKLAVLLP